MARSFFSGRDPPSRLGMPRYDTDLTLPGLLHGTGDILIPQHYPHVLVGSSEPVVCGAPMDFEPNQKLEELHIHNHAFQGWVQGETCVFSMNPFNLPLHNLLTLS